jgi:hypothetical protein
LRVGSPEKKEKWVAYAGREFITAVGKSLIDLASKYLHN